MAVEEGWDVLLEANSAANASDDDQPAAKKTNVAQTSESASEAPSPPAGGEEVENDKSLHTLARLDTCVTVVDASSMMSILADTRTVSDTEDKAAPEDERSLAELLVDQIEFANVILLNKIDAVSPAKVKECMGLLIAMNPDAKIIPTRYSRVPLEEILNTGKFDMDKASAAPGTAG
jgi:G3E family GTPase